MKVYLDTIGCRVNQAEIEQFACQFRALGHELTGEPQGADLAVVNTCAVTAAATSDSRSAVRRIWRAGVTEIAVTGCWATLAPYQAQRLPGVTHVVPNDEKDALVSTLLHVPNDLFELEPVEREPIPGARLRTRFFLKVQDGCDNRCTFCITTLARGRGRSRPLAELVDTVVHLTAPLSAHPPVQEVVLCGVHLGSWGRDLSPALTIKTLIRTLLRETDVPRLRLSSLEPWDIDADFFALWEDGRLCRHLHLPLQSGCAATLRRMARKTTPQAYATLVELARQAIPGVAITTDLIAGFPGETEAEFEESLEFVQRLGFSGGHVFTFSERPGTAAASMPAQVAPSVRKRRSHRLRAVLEEAARGYQQGFLGQVLPVLWESAVSLGPQGWRMVGLTDNYLRLQAVAPRRLWNQITPVELIDVHETPLIGRIVPAPSEDFSFDS